MSRSRVLILLGAICVVGAVVRALGWPDAPESWDGVGFVEAVQQLDLAQFRPHPPGYPLFVASCKLVSLVVRTPLHAVTTVSFLFGVAAPIAAHLLVDRISGSTVAGLFAAAMIAVTPGMVVASVATLPDGAAVVLAMFAYAAALGFRGVDAWIAGGLVGACLGMRPSSLLLVLPVIAICWRGRGVRGVAFASLGTLLSTTAWAIPMAKVVGAARWWALSRAQLQGHMAHWGESEQAWRGGTFGVLRALPESIALQLGGVEGNTAALAMGVLLSVLLAALSTSRSMRSVLWVPMMVLPYALAVALWQPVAAAPRHVLPVTAAVVLTLVIALARTEPARASRKVLVALVAMIGVVGVQAARAHKNPPAAVAMLRYVSRDPAMMRAAVVGGRSSRFAQHLGPGYVPVRVAPGALPGDAIVYAMRADPFPDPLLITDELDLRNLAPWRLQRVATFQRDSPLDRRERSLTLYRLFIVQPVQPRPPAAMLP